MSLTDEAETFEMFKAPVIEKHRPNWLGDSEMCDYMTGHCTNTTACEDCKLYQSVMRIREYEARQRGE